jgi:hypothetical protein
MPRPRQPRKATLKTELQSQLNKEPSGKKHVGLKRDSPGKHSKSKLSARAKAQKELEKENAFEGTFTAIYQKPVDVNQTVELQKMGKLFSRKYIVESVEYEFGAGKLDVRYSTVGD